MRRTSSRGRTRGSWRTPGPRRYPGGERSSAPARDAFGSATVTVVLQDDGGTASGGVDTSVPQSFTLTVTPVNDAPVATADAYTVDEDSILTVAAQIGRA